MDRDDQKNADLLDIARAIRDLTERAKRADAPTTAYLLEMAALDAEANARSAGTEAV